VPRDYQRQLGHPEEIRVCLRNEVADGAEGGIAHLHARDHQTQLTRSLYDAEPGWEARLVAL
jgi:hypothetical protein